MDKYIKLVTYGTALRRTRLAGHERESYERYIPTSDNDNKALRYFAHRTITVPVCTPPTMPRAAALYSWNKKKTTHCNDALGRDLICEKKDKIEKLRRSFVDNEIGEWEKCWNSYTNTIHSTYLMRLRKISPKTRRILIARHYASCYLY